MAEAASDSLKMNPPDLLRLGVIDEIVPEPLGGAHRNWPKAIELLKKALEKNVKQLLAAEAKTKKDRGEVYRHARLEKFRKMGAQALGRTTESN